MSMETLKVKIIKKAWEDPEFKAQLLADPKSALQASFGMKIPQEIELITVEETPSRYYLVIPPNPADLDSEDGGMSSTEYVWS
ncbi:NHLP leader peptide family RiPP precursor [Paenibacillus alkalitolerans]|uniref:NHLP leader peptide family RiPP precursor n=1 Tax=Paenibacillus alkalitolerans TaxID=2799335 RepID=UPI0018F3EEE9|nr:NHLP leader peptide family RiPP precursor [Paenibacillus alkalitolerans]